MTFNEALEYLLGLGHETLAIKFGLEKTRLILESLGSPQNSFLKIQIAGTNGKGSTAAFLDSICRAAGIRTGLYTSPHLVKITERIRVDGVEIDEARFGESVSLVRDCAMAMLDQGRIESAPTFFEHVTLAALCAFKCADVEIAILETGLGGRLDSTTAAEAEIVAITPVGLDHQEYLGETLAQIAAEKAAILRAGVKAVIAPQHAEASAVILNLASRLNVDPVIVGESFWRHATPAFDGRMSVDFKLDGEWIGDTVLGLRGRHQIENAAAAVALALELKTAGFPIAVESIRKRLFDAVHPGRIEVVDGDPVILLDGAHNPHGANALAEYLKEFISQPVTMVFGAMRDKDLQSVLTELTPTVSTIVLTLVDSPRAATMFEMNEALERIAFTGKRLEGGSARDALVTAYSITPENGTICVAGSLYLVGEIRNILAEQGIKLS